MRKNNQSAWRRGRRNSIMSSDVSQKDEGIYVEDFNDSNVMNASTKNFNDGSSMNVMADYLSPAEKKSYEMLEHSMLPGEMIPDKYSTIKGHEYTQKGPSKRF